MKISVFKNNINVIIDIINKKINKILRASQISIYLIVGLCFVTGLFLHIEWNDLSILQARSLDEYAFVEPLINISDGIKVFSLEKIFSFIFYSYGFLYFFLNFLSTFLYLDEIMNPAFISSIRVLAVSIFCANLLIFYKIIDQSIISLLERVVLMFILVTMPAIWTFSGYIHPDFLMMCSFLASVMSMIKADKQINKFYWFSLALYGFAISIKFQALIFFPFYIWVWLAYLSDKSSKKVFFFRSIVKSLFLILFIFIATNPYVLSSQGFDAWMASINADFLSNKTNHGNDERVLLMDKLNFSLFEFYYDKFVLAVLLFSSIFMVLKESYKKSFSVYGGIAIFCILYFCYLMFFVNKSWALYFLPFGIASIIVLINLPEMVQFKFFKIKRFRLILLSTILLSNVLNNFALNKEIFLNHFNGNSISYDAINKNEIVFVNPQNELIKSRELADILRNFPNQSKIITTPYVNFPFKQLNKTYMDVRTIYDFDKILNISDLSGKDLIFIINKRYESEIKKILGKTNASLLGTTNDYLLFDLQT